MTRHAAIHSSRYLSILQKKERTLREDIEKEILSYNDIIDMYILYCIIYQYLGGNSELVELLSNSAGQERKNNRTNGRQELYTLYIRLSQNMPTIRLTS